MLKKILGLVKTVINKVARVVFNKMTPICMLGIAALCFVVPAALCALGIALPATLIIVTLWVSLIAAGVTVITSLLIMICSLFNIHNPYTKGIIEDIKNYNKNKAESNNDSVENVEETVPETFLDKDNFPNMAGNPA